VQAAAVLPLPLTVCIFVAAVKHETVGILHSFYEYTNYTENLHKFSLKSIAPWSSHRTLGILTGRERKACRERWVSRNCCPKLCSVAAYDPTEDFGDASLPSSLPPRCLCTSKQNIFGGKL